MKLGMMHENSPLECDQNVRVLANIVTVLTDASESIIGMSEYDKRRYPKVTEMAARTD